MENNLSISLASYALNGSGMGSSSQAEVDLLMKSLTAGSITGRDTENQGATGGAVLKVESLENSLKVLDFNESEIVLWKRIPKTPAHNTTEEYDQLKSWGTMGNSFNREGELPEEDDTAYARKNVQIKYMGKTGSVSHPMQLVNVITGVGNVTEHKVKATTMTLLRDANMALVNADSSIVDEEWNGLYKQHKDAALTLGAYYAQQTVIDCRGKILKEEHVAAANLALIQNHAIGKLLMAPPAVLNNFTYRFNGMKFINPNTPQVTDGIMGQAVNAVQTQFGKVELAYDLFMSTMYVGMPKTSASAATHVKAPAAPTVTGAAVSDAQPTWTGFTGDYIYAVTAVNRHGESAPTFISAVTVGANQSVDLTITAAASVVPATGFKIYKTVKDLVTGTVTAHYLFAVSTAELATGYDGGAAGKVRDRNRILPNTETAFLMDPTLDVYGFKQLLPIMKMDLPPLGPSTRYCVLMYGSPVLYAPSKMVKFINIGDSLS